MKRFTKTLVAAMIIAATGMANYGWLQERTRCQVVR
jgi:hypothetical protein